MQRDARKYLFDIQTACRLISEFSEGQTIDSFRNNPLLRSAIERQFQIIGEALQQLFRTYPEVARLITDYRNIINFRHILVHGYDKVEEDVTWGIVQSRLSILLDEVDSLLSGSGT
jgi:uncharacterized protein with HEPN domain